MALRGRTNLSCLAWALLALAGAAIGVPSARADQVALLDARHPVEDVTQALRPVLEPTQEGDNRVSALVPRTIKSEYSYSGWLALSIQNSGEQPIDRVLVFTHPALARAGIFGAPLGAPRLVALRYVEGELPASLPLAGPANRFAILGVHLEPGVGETIALKVENGSHAMAIQAWEPQALARFDTYFLLAIGLYWGILFVGVGLLFSLRVLSGGPGLIAGGFLALAALVFEAASFGFGGASWTLPLSRVGLDPAAALRPLSLVFIAFFGVQFLRRLFDLREEVPLLDVGLRVFQYFLLAALPLIFFWSVGPVAARAACALALLVSGGAVLFLRRSMPETLQLVPPGWLFLSLAGLGALAVSGTGLGDGSVIIELGLHGLFVIGIMLLVFAAVVRAGAPRTALESAAPAEAPAFARAAERSDTAGKMRTAPDATSSYQGLWDWSITEDRLYVSPSVEAMMGLVEGALGGRERSWSQRILEADRAIYSDTLRHYIDQGNSSFTLEFRVRHQAGDTRWLQLRATGLAGDDGRAARLIGVVTDITSAKLAEEQIVREASHDALTGLGNRAFLIAHVDWALAQYRDQPVLDAETGQVIQPALLFIDLDRFKSVNDELGHAAGDQLLIQLAKRLQESLGPADVIARFGNDEFVVLLSPSLAGERGGQMTPPEEMAEFLQDLCAQPIELAGQKVYPSATIGVVRFEPRHREAQEILADAETAMRRARRRGAGEIDTFTERRAVKRPPAISLDADLRQAIQREEMLVLYQPIMSLRTGAIAGFEALLRWRHKERGMLGPELFVALAEETGMIVTLGRFALSMAAIQLAQWQSFFPLRRPLFVTVNVSSRQLLRSDFVKDVVGVLSSVELAPDTLKLEVTESMVFDDEARVAELLAAVRAKGVSLALDDYGRGYSSLSRLRTLPLSTVKIDKEFVDGVGDNGQADAILRSTIAMAHEMNLDVVCEGVERPAQAGALQTLGADYAQGFLFGAPMPAAEAQRFIAKNWKPESRTTKAG
jgi:diguanylate cyclase (GGDEF)-like protein/PAS domain S-box-containing protein